MNSRLIPNPQSRLSNGQRELAQAHAGPRGDAAVLDKVVEPERGHWRNIFRHPSDTDFDMSRVLPGGGWLNPGEWCSPVRFVTEREAVADGIRLDAKCAKSPKFCGWKYLRTEFFPEYG